MRLTRQARREYAAHPDVRDLLYCCRDALQCARAVNLQRGIYVLSGQVQAQFQVCKVPGRQAGCKCEVLDSLLNEDASQSHATPGPPQNVVRYFLAHAVTKLFQN